MNIYHTVARATGDSKRAEFLESQQKMNEETFSSMLKTPEKLTANWKRSYAQVFVLYLEPFHHKIARIILESTFRNGYKTQIRKRIWGFSYWKTIAFDQSPSSAKYYFNAFLKGEKLMSYWKGKKNKEVYLKF